MLDQPARVPGHGRRDADRAGQPHGRRARDPDRRRNDPRDGAAEARADVVRPGLPQHRVDEELDHVHRRRRRDPPLSRLPDRAARRARELPRDRVAHLRRRAADEGRAHGVGERGPLPHLRAHERDDVPRRLPPRRAPDGDAARGDGGAVDLLSRREGDWRRREPPPPEAAADREVPDDRRVGVPPQPRPAVRLPAQRPRLHRQFRQHDVRDRWAARAEPGAAAGARDPPHPPRRPRAERIDERGARSRVDAGGSVLRSVGRDRGAVRPAARRRERSRPPDARRDRRREERPGLHRGSEKRERLLMGFGHRVYKNYDPRAKLIKRVADDVFAQTGLDPKLEIALELERIALEDDFFIERKLYPNVDFYSGIIYRAMGYPTDYFTVLFALGRLPGWLAQWEEMLSDPEQKIARPRQIYTGYDEREFVPLAKR